ncbi:SusC/RagA family TonB-linked outer membrane protein [Flavobacterium tructae]|uniref:SusC/RagA family TonB-linked outer membrane protein n=1 Tax=Flavobacterium tructae TaxID=1114873 RepID=A0A1S1J5D8_9FLAO|nr:SusC/RagA family TonB-linked outer membrane protein [Flavobacterium tructae]OHT44699.1 SusC/RagA family TonB-linked outer membrane protein [Flavobacterium tructae]OXB19162.1 SusC/RagA family TonB-linked outer membrane protein [Flavobacterium tructae]
MKLKFNGLLVLLLVLVAQLTFAQERAVSGTVSDNTGMPLPGVSVLIKGTKTGTQTDFDGKYSIKASSNQVLVFSYIGMKSQEVAATSSAINVKLLDGAAQQLESVVVTAFGIKRNPKKLGYSVSEVKAEQITQNSEPDLSRALAGKVAGVNINTSTGVAGAANQITIRGVNSLTGNTDPLIIVDGIAYSNVSVTSTSQITGGGGYESALSSLDPNDIASINVLKSTAAAALYGSRAMNGVIVVTTKSGASKPNKTQKLNVNVGMGTYFETIANLPDYQNTYGSGANFQYSNANGSWGPRFDSLATIPTWPTLLAAFPDQFGPTVPYVAKPNNVKDLFRTGTVLDKTIGFNYAGQDGTFNATISDLRQDGYIPYNSYDRTSMSAGGNFKLSKKFTVGANLAYSKTKQVGGFFGENQFAGSSSSFARTLFLARNWDLNLPYVDPVTGGSVTPNGTQFDHPLWSWQHDQIITNTDRIVAGINLNYTLNDNISASYRAGINKYSLARSQVRDLASRANNGLGNLLADNYVNQDIESTFLLNFNYELNENFKLATIVGNNVLQNEYSRLVNEGREFIVPNIFTFKNVKSIANLTDERAMKRNVGVFADVTLSYRDYLFLNATARNDWSSSLPKERNSYFYPSVSASAVITDAFNIQSDILTFAKLRASFAKVGRDVPAEFLKISYNQGQAYNGLPRIGNNTFLGDQDVKPEFSEEFEIGTDLEFFRKRIVVDLSLYSKTTKDLITPVTVASSTGFTELNTNAGSIRNRGIELGLTLVPVKSKNFTWSLLTNFTKNENEVLTLKEGLDRIQLNANQIAYAIPGQPFGVFYGTRFARDANGNYLINRSGGAVIQDPSLGVIGDPNAKFRVSFANTFTYKAWSLRAQIDWKQGGDISSSTIESLLGRGVTRDTEDREKTFIIPGYYGNNDGTPILDANGNQIPNSTQLSMNELYFSPAGGSTFGINSVDEATIYDGTVFRLREINLTYDVPSKILEKTPFGKISLSFIANNLWYFAPNVPKYTNFDPETTSYGNSTLQGIETSAAPTAKRWGFKINLTF